MAYRGTTQVTSSGLVCQKWNVDNPHERYAAATNSSNFPDGNLEEAWNYCRNPNGSPSPWCYTTEKSVVWEACDIPKCESKSDNMDLLQF